MMIDFACRKSTVLLSMVLIAFLSATICAGTEDPLSAVDSLELCYKFEETQGSVTKDYSGNDRNGTLVNMAVDGWGPGYHDNALSFDGVNDYVSITGYKGVLGQVSRTIAAWIKTDLVGGIVSWGVDDRAEKYVFGIRDNRVPGAIRLEVNGGFLVATTDVRDNQWHHVAVVMDNDGTPDVTEVTFYVDGKKELIGDDKPFKIDTGAGWDVNVGRALRAGRHFRGLMDDVCIFSSALTEDEIIQLAILGPDSFIQPCGLLDHPELALAGDINKDCTVNIDDLVVMLDNWLDAGLIPGQIELDDIVDITDFAALAELWQWTVEPD